MIPTTDTLDIYAPDAEAAWERAVRDALDKVRPGMGEALVLGEVDYHYPTVYLQHDEDGLRFNLSRDYRFGLTKIAIMETRGRLRHVTAASPEPIGAICLALCAYRRAVEGVRHGD